MGYTWQYYDLVLAAVAASLLAGTAVAFGTGVSPPLAIAGASLVAIAVIGHGLFVNGPVDGIEDLAEEVESLN